MSVEALLAIGVLLVAWTLVSERLRPLGLSAPMVFVGAGILVGETHVAGIEVDLEAESVRLVAELTLAIVLFSDASRIVLRRLEHDAGWAARLLLVGLPLSVVVGAAVGRLVLGDLGWALVALPAAVLAATDASLSVAVITDERVPERARRALNVESGLNDGMATPVVLVLIAAAAGALGVDGVDELTLGSGEVAVDLLGGVVLGALLGAVGARAIAWSAQRGWSAIDGRRLAVLVLALVAYLAADQVGVNGFLAAFAAGMAFRWGAPDATDELIEVPDIVGELLAWVTWFVFGAALVVPALEAADWRVALYAAASLTVVRMVPVLLALAGSDADRPTRWLLAWFGPRGLASVVFALLIAEALPAADPAVARVEAAIAATVLLSIVAHAVTATPLIRRLTTSEASPPPG